MGTPARPPSFPLALAAVVIANVASVFVSVVVVGAVASVSVYALVAAPYGAAAAVAHDGGYVRALVAIAVAVPIVLWFLQAAVARWVILSNGAAASFGRALAAFAIADVVGVTVAAVVAAGHVRGPGILLSWAGVFVSAAVLSAPIARSTAAPPSGAYRRPPDAPSDWPWG